MTIKGVTTLIPKAMMPKPRTRRTGRRRNDIKLIVLMVLQLHQAVIFDIGTIRRMFVLVDNDYLYGKRSVVPILYPKEYLTKGNLGIAIGDQRIGLTSLLHPPLK